MIVLAEDTTLFLFVCLVVSWGESTWKEALPDSWLLLVMWLKGPRRNEFVSSSWWSPEMVSKCFQSEWTDLGKNVCPECWRCPSNEDYLCVRNHRKTKRKLVCVGDKLLPKLGLAIYNNKLPFMTINGVKTVTFLQMIWMPINLLLLFLSEVYSIVKVTLGYL